MRISKSIILKNSMDKINEIIGQKNLVIDTIDFEIFRSFIYKMISVKPDEVVFCIAGNKNYSDKEFSERRHEFETKNPLATGTYKSEKYDKIMNYRVVII
jgi:site-specific DNA recombinase